jgi:hypothetical protein
VEPTACFVHASYQNAFFSELLDALAEALSEHGVGVERAIDRFPELREGLVYIFVPHELLPLLMPDGHPSEPQLQRSVTICTEQPGTSWFEEDARIAKRAARALDINRLGVSALEGMGVAARLLQLGYVGTWDRWHGEEGLDRDVDVTFLAGETPRRLQAIASCARQLAGRRTQLHLLESLVPHLGGSPHFLAGERKWQLLRKSKLLINVHRSELQYFEWQRAVEAITNGCVLLTEHSLGFEPLVPGEHFVSISAHSLDAALEALLADAEGVSRLRRDAYRFLREEHSLARSIAVLAETVGEVASQPLPGARARALRTVPRPKPPQPRPAEYQLVLGRRDDGDVLRMAVKHLFLEQRELRRQISELQAGPARAEDTITRFGPRGTTGPRVSVVLTVYNYESVVGTAIDSVAVSDFTDYELVIVDDGSTDNSAAAIQAALDGAPWVSGRLIERAQNGGLPQARNLGVRHAAGELIFILDADNALYPHGLGRLVRALDDEPGAVFAYGIIEKVGVDGPIGLMSYLGWDRQRLRHGNFIDAMAMIRRTPLLEAGGYVIDRRLYGWEDFALWCTFAERGWQGVRVPEIVARYRAAFHSMVSVTNIDTTDAWSVLLDRFPGVLAGASAYA